MKAKPQARRAGGAGVEPEAATPKIGARGTATRRKKTAAASLEKKSNTRKKSAAAAGRPSNATRGSNAGGTGARVRIELPPVATLSDTLAAIREHHRQREDFHRAETRLTLQIKAIGRRMAAAAGAPANTTHADPTVAAGAPDDRAGANGATDPAETDAPPPAAMPLMEARAHLHRFRLMHERVLAKLAERLPVWPWVESVRGFGALAFAQVVGEAGDLATYANPAKLWKRFGLAVIAGERQRKCTDKAKAEAHGYNPRRRSIMWNVGECLVKQNQNPATKEPGTYRAIYLARKEFEVGRNPEMTPMHAHRRAQRYMEKRFLRDLWAAWRRAVDDVHTEPPNAGADAYNPGTVAVAYPESSTPGHGGRPEPQPEPKQPEPATGGAA